MAGEATFTNRFRILIDAGQIREAKALVQREISELRALAQGGASAGGAYGRQAVSEAAAGVPVVSAAAGELASRGAGSLKVRELDELRSDLTQLGRMFNNMGKMSDTIGRLDRAMERVAGREESRARDGASGRLQVPPGVADTHIGRRAEASVERLAELEAADRRELVAAVRARRDAEKRITQIERQVEAEARGESTARRPPTAVQRIQGYIRRRAGDEDVDESRFLTGKQLIASRLLTTASFAASGALLYGAVQTIREMVEQATILERTFNQIQRQFESMGKGEQFAGFRSQILAISRETGETAQDVARVGFQFMGAFHDTATAVQATSNAIKIARVTGLELNEVIDSLTAAAYGFRQGGETQADTIKAIGDEALGLQERFGVLAKESIQFFGDIAPIAKEAGLSIKDMGALIGVAQQTSGRSGGALAEGFGRILPAIHNVSVELLALYRTSSDPRLTAQVPAMIEAIRAGGSGEVLKRLVRDWNLLTKSQQEQAISLLGGRREAQAIIPVLENSAAVVSEWDRKTTDAGKTASYFGDLQETLSQRMARARATLVQLGDALFRSGLGDILKDLVAVGAGALTIIAGLARGFASLNEFTHGLAGRLLEIVVAMRAFRALAGVDAFAGIASMAAGGWADIRARGGVRATVNEQLAGRGGGAVVRSALMNPRIGLGAAGAAAYGASALFPEGSGANQAFGALGNIGVGAAFGGPLGAVAAGGFSVVNAYGSTRSVVRKQADQFREHLQNETAATLRAMLKDVHSSLFEQFAFNFFGTQSPEEIISQEYHKRNLPENTRRLRAARDANLVLNSREQGRTLYQELGGRDAYRQTVAQALGTSPEARASYGITRRQYGLEDDTLRITPEIQKRLEDDIKAGGQRAAAAQKLINAINHAVAGVPEAFAAYQTALTSGDAGRAQQSARDLLKPDEQTHITPAAATADAIKQQLQSGQINQAKALEELGALKESYELIGTTNLDPARQQEYATLLKDIATTQGDIAKRSAEFYLSLQKVQGAYEPQVAVNLYTQLAGNADFTPDQRAEFAQQAVNAANEQFNFLLKRARTTEEVDRVISQGFKVPVEAQRAFLRQELNLDTKWQAIDTQLKTNLDLQGVNLDEIINGAISGGKSVREAAVQYIENQIHELERIAALPGQPEEVTTGIEQKIAALRGLQTQIQGATDYQATTGGLSPEQLQSAFSAFQQKARAAATYAKSQHLGDPVAQALDEVAAAKKEVAEAEKLFGVGSPEWQQAIATLNNANATAAEARIKINDLKSQLRVALMGGKDPVAAAAEELGQARRDYADNVKQFGRSSEQALQAQIDVANKQSGLDAAVVAQNQAALHYQQVLDQGSPVQAALDGVAIAQQAVNAAKVGTTEWYNAQAQLVEAQRQVSQAQLDMFNAQLDVNKAIAAAAGDQVGVAEIEIQQAGAALNEARGRGNRKDELSAEARLIGARAQRTEAQISTGERDIDFALQMEQISTQQAITELEGLLRIPGITKERTQQILLKINQLRKEASKDLQFDIPTDIKLPTLYEVRRLRQSEAAGYGYNDNRQIMVQYNVYTPLDHTQTMEDLAGVIAGSPRTGVQPRSYP